MNKAYGVGSDSSNPMAGAKIPVAAPKIEPLFNVVCECLDLAYGLTNKADSLKVRLFGEFAVANVTDEQAADNVDAYARRLRGLLMETREKLDYINERTK